MIAFEVYVNGSKACTAGLGEMEFIMGGLTCFAKPDGPPGVGKPVFSVSGMSDKKYFNWVHYEMSVGSEVEIRIINALKGDEPKQIDCPGGSCAT